ncbi:GGDEF domain-containing protein [Marinomonas ostreistagni]|uniref:diguanylate cyclase n=1 Tax=Marinomonas ostreistagni TaxID=359209 RepID=A0ABS0Z6T4_9GAMM|nr:GGDEF domain-containing protein [Marinomonas ostreistagni]MBJ7549364.1 GGDEF domain-containing protein [Marinomonas ostreistagni]
MSQFVLSKLFACYVFVAGIALAGFFLWSHQQLALQHEKVTQQLESYFLNVLEMPAEEQNIALDSVMLGVELSSKNGSPISLVSLENSEGAKLVYWGENSDSVSANIESFYLADKLGNQYQLHISFSDSTLAGFVYHHFLPVLGLLSFQLALLLLTLRILINRSLDGVFSGFMRELSVINLRHPEPLQADAFLGQFAEYRQMLASVNRVILSLARSREELSDINEELETRIHDKTAVLEERNEELLELNKQLSVIANTDALTQVYNRTRFDVLFKEHVAIATRRHTPLSILLVDLDDFKKVNDQHGHQVGDQVLKHAARVIQHIALEDGIVARWGGEEFAVLLPYFDLSMAEEKAERLRAEMANAVFEQQAIKVTASIGVAQLCMQETASQLLKRADDALYDAKGGGRNRVIIAYLENSHTQLEIDDLQAGEFIEVFDVALEPSQDEPEASQKLLT